MTKMVSKHFRSILTTVPASLTVSNFFVAELKPFCLVLGWVCLLMVFNVNGMVFWQNRHIAKKLHCSLLKTITKRCPRRHNDVSLWTQPSQSPQPYVCHERFCEIALRWETFFTVKTFCFNVHVCLFQLIRACAVLWNTHPPHSLTLNPTASMLAAWSLLMSVNTERFHCENHFSTT